MISCIVDPCRDVSEYPPHFQRDCNNVRQGRVHSPYWIQWRMQMYTRILLVGRLSSYHNYQLVQHATNFRFMRCSLGDARLKKILPFYSKISASSCYIQYCARIIFFLNNPTCFIFMGNNFCRNPSLYICIIYSNFLFYIYNFFF